MTGSTSGAGRCWSYGCADLAIPAVQLCVYHVVILHDAQLDTTAVNMRRPTPRPRRQPTTPGTGRPGPATVEEVVALVADYLGMRPDRICRRSDPQHTYARHLAAYLARQQGASLPVIAGVFGQDHTTVLSATRKVRRLVERDSPPVAGDVADLERALGGVACTDRGVSGTLRTL